MTQLATVLKAWRADEAALYVRQKIAERGWTEEIEAMAMRYVYDDDGVPQYRVSMGDIAFEGAIEPPVVRDWFTPVAGKWTRLMYGRRGGWFAFGWLFWVVALWFGFKLLLYGAVMAALFAVFMLTMTYDLATYPLRKRR